jgi:Glycosyl transferase family 2
MVDDGAEKIGALADSDDPQIHYSAFDGRENHGRKMNRSCTAAAGDSRVVTDDDHLYPQDRVERLTTGLLGGEKVVVAGTSRVIFDHIVAICTGGCAYDT